jgi:lipid A ethanolaminephosphotransferase
MRLPGFRSLVAPCHVEPVIVLAAMLLALPLNLAFWSALLGGLGPFDLHDAKILCEAFLILGALLVLLLTAISWRPAFKPALSVLLLTSAATAYFMNQYQVVIDGDMISNVFATDGREVLDLLTPKLALYLVFLGVLPALWLWRTPLLDRPWRQTLLRRGALAAGAAGLLIGVLLLGYQDIAPVSRNHRALRYTIVPFNYLYGVGHFVARGASRGDGKIETVGLDARSRMKAAAKERPKVVVLVVGETARADHFSLNGYPRPTSPELQRLAGTDTGLVNLDNFWSCGTATGISLPCMFSNFGQINFSEVAAQRRENLLDVVFRAGVPVRWIDNNSGCKGVCARVSGEDVSNLPGNPLCTSGECFDEVLIERLERELATVSGDRLIVLHQKGSHGPAYYKRYPKSFEQFKPVCENSQLDRCDLPSIVNAYDNTIAYTDHVLAQLIARLRQSEADVDSALLYMSDHGESLGESGLYLHGMPYALAPDAQKHVPALLWMGSGMIAREEVELACLRGRHGDRFTHDSLFHTILGLLDIETAAHDEKLDLLAPCRKVRSARAKT